MPQPEPTVIVVAYSLLQGCSMRDVREGFPMHIGPRVLVLRFRPFRLEFVVGLGSGQQGGLGCGLILPR